MPPKQAQPQTREGPSKQALKAAQQAKKMSQHATHEAAKQAAKHAKAVAHAAKHAAAAAVLASPVAHAMAKSNQQKMPQKMSQKMPPTPQKMGGAAQKPTSSKALLIVAAIAFYLGRCGVCTRHLLDHPGAEEDGQAAPRSHPSDPICKPPRSSPPHPTCTAHTSCRDRRQRETSRCPYTHTLGPAGAGLP